MWIPNRRKREKLGQQTIDGDQLCWKKLINSNFPCLSLKIASRTPFSLPLSFLLYRFASPLDITTSTDLFPNAGELQSAILIPIPRQCIFTLSFLLFCSFISIFLRQTHHFPLRARRERQQANQRAAFCIRVHGPFDVSVDKFSINSMNHRSIASRPTDFDMLTRARGRARARARRDFIPSTIKFITVLKLFHTVIQHFHFLSLSVAAFVLFSDLLRRAYPLIRHAIKVLVYPFLSLFLFFLFFFCFPVRLRFLLLTPCPGAAFSLDTYQVSFIPSGACRNSSPARRNDHAMRFFIIAPTGWPRSAGARGKMERNHIIYFACPSKDTSVRISVENKFISYVHNNFIYCLLPDCMNNDVGKTCVRCTFAEWNRPSHRIGQLHVEMNEWDTRQLMGERERGKEMSETLAKYKADSSGRDAELRRGGAKSNDNIVLVSLINGDVCWLFSFSSYHRWSCYT